jgi:hypothetical protein
MAFNDGEPIDAAKLGALETSLAEIKAKVPQFGSGASSIIKVDNTSTSNIVIPQIYAGVSDAVKIQPGKTSTFTINYPDAGLTSNPRSIILTPYRDSNPGISHNEAYVVKGLAGPKSAQCKVYQPSGYTAGTTFFYFLVIQHS